ncbi:hypothetical protein A3L09_04850 [Thermococcus profundus]|uniref:Uncharacterized protein n=2 Tax=Thermococcus profundus TaxID=49899 RepID=A0A2Z2MDE4_THEPR|nr:hypothetical protein A3L09_04850 [Thermococcus profundus]
MKTWEGVRMYENVVCKSPEDLFLLIQEALRIGDGALVRVFSSSGNYYFHLLFDDEKLLLGEARSLRTNGRITGRPMLSMLMEVLKEPFVADVMALTDSDIKNTLLANIDLYESTPKVLLFEMFTPRLWQSPFTPEAGVKSETSLSLE